MNARWLVAGVVVLVLVALLWYFADSSQTSVANPSAGDPRTAEGSAGKTAVLGTHPGQETQPDRRLASELEEGASGLGKAAFRVKVVWAESREPVPNAEVHVWQDTESKPLDTVSIQLGDEECLSARTDSRGNTTFRLKNWNIKIQAMFGEEGVSRIYDLTAAHTWSLVRRETALVIRLLVSCKISGRVVDRNGIGVNGAIVKLHSQGEFLGSTSGRESYEIPVRKARAHGVFSAIVPANREYSLAVISGADPWLPGVWDYTAPISDSVHIDVGNTEVRDVVLTLRGRFSIRGQVLLTDGATAEEGLLIGARCGQAGGAALTDPQGRFELLLHAKGTYAVSYFGSAHPATADLKVEVSRETPSPWISMTLPEEMDIKVELIGGDVQDLNLLEVGAIDRRCKSWSQSERVSDRIWKVRGLAVGRKYTIFCRRRGEEEAGLTRALLKTMELRRGESTVRFDVPDVLLKRDKVACEIGGMDPQNKEVEIELAVLEGDRWQSVETKSVHQQGRIPWGPVLIPGRSYRFSARVRGIAAGESRIFTSGNAGEFVTVDLVATGTLCVRVSKESPIGRVKVEDELGPLVQGRWKRPRLVKKDDVDREVEWQLPAGPRLVVAEISSGGNVERIKRRVLVVAGKKAVLRL